MIVMLRERAGEFERFTVEAANNLLGQRFMLKHKDIILGEGQVIAAELVKNGQAIDLTVEWPDNLLNIVAIER